jgi:hypothetical protein
VRYIHWAILCRFMMLAVRFMYLVHTGSELCADDDKELCVSFDHMCQNLRDRILAHSTVEDWKKTEEVI